MWGLDATAPKKHWILPYSWRAEKTGSLERAEGANMQTKPNQFLIKEGRPACVHPEDTPGGLCLNQGFQ